MKIYAQVVRDLDSGGANYSRDLSEVDLSDPEDVKVTVADPNGEVLVHLGSSDYLERFKVYVAHIQDGASSSRKCARWICATTGRSSSIPMKSTACGNPKRRQPKPRKR